MAESLGLTETVATIDKLFAGDMDAVEVPVTVKSGAGKLLRGQVLGKIIKGAATASAVTGTGNGVIGAITLGKASKVGVYKLRCITAATDAGVFSVFDPDGIRLADLTVAVAYNNGHFAVTVADGSADFIVGDNFTITVAAGTGKYVAYDDTKTDGTDKAALILGRDIDATSADVKAFAYRTGVFNKAALTGIDDAGIADLDERGIFVKVIG
jgi:hypothetical protein